MNQTSPYIDREKSWLAFNSRVLQEAADQTVPLLDRLRFLGIFSNNLDEFFRVRYAAIRRLSLNKEIDTTKLFGGITAHVLLKEITQIVINQQTESLKILYAIEQQLEEKNIYILNEKELDDAQKEFIRNYFIQQISPAIVTIMLNDLNEFPLLKDTNGYLAVKLVLKPNKKTNTAEETRYAIVEIPSQFNRFVVLPEKNKKQFIILLDDVIRFNLNYLFNIFDYKTIAAHMIKITRDAQLDFDSDLNKSFLKNIR